jgi:hypothetical protein
VSAAAAPALAAAPLAPAAEKPAPVVEKPAPAEPAKGGKKKKGKGR